MEVTRRQRRATREGVDVRQVLTRRGRAPQGARGVGRGVHGPAREAERPSALGPVPWQRESRPGPGRPPASQADAGARGSG
jgi:hypothetical protein